MPNSDVIYAHETSCISDYLIRINRLGFLTTSSQPGGTRGIRPSQRAYVAGLMLSDDTARFNERLGRVYPEAVVRDPSSGLLPVGRETDGTVCSFAWGGRMGDAIYRDEYALSDDDMASLRIIEVVDTAWDGNPVFWTAVIQALVAA